MFKVTKNQADYIRKHAKNVRIAITGRGKRSRHKKWYVDESMETLQLLDKYSKLHTTSSVRAE